MLVCPKCETQRYHSNGKQRKAFQYFPIAQRLALYQNINLVKILQTHCTKQQDGFIRDIWDTEKWKNWFSNNGEFEGFDSECVLSFCSDGVNPFKSMHLIYSMWPIMVSVLNFPIALRKSVGRILLTGIVPGNGRKEANHIDPYLDILVEELLILADCHIYHAPYMSAPVNIKVKLLPFILSQQFRN